MNYTSDFDDSPVQTATVGYSSLTLAAAVTQLYWPATSGVLPPLARLMDIVAPAANLVIKLPPANSASLGTDAVLTNRGANKIFIQDFDGNDIGSISSGISVYTYVSDNASEAGGWSTLVFGAGTSAANASDLDGFGLVSAANKLNIGIQTTPLTTDYTVSSTDRATLLAWQSGVGTISLPLVSSLLSSGFLFEFSNSGTGTVSIDAHGSDLIDGVGSITVQPGESCFVICDQTNNAWYTVGRGRSRLFGYTLLTKAVTTGTVTLTQTEASSTVQRYTGTLTGNVTIVLPEIVQVYYVTNQTSGVFSLTFKTSAGGGSNVSVPAGQSAVLLSDGTNVVAGNAIDANVPIRLSIYDFGCRGNGSFDDITNLNSALAFAATIASAVRPVDLEFNGGQCAVSGQVIPVAGVGMRNGGLKALGTGSLSATVPMVLLNGGNNVHMTSMVLDCNRISAGILANGANTAIVDRVQIRNFVGYGFGNRGGTNDLQLRNVLCEEWTAGDAGETDYTLRTAIGFDMQGGDYTAVNCHARFCLVPIHINQVGGGMAAWICPKVHNGSSGGVKPNLPSMRVTAMGGSLIVSEPIFEDGYVDIKTFPAVSFRGGLFRSTAASTVVTVFQATSTILNDTGAGLSIIGARYTGFSLFIFQATTGGTSWSTGLLWSIHDCYGGVGGMDHPELQRMSVPNGTLASPGIAYDDTTTGWYRNTAASVNIGFGVGGVSKLALRTDNALRLGDGSTVEELQVNSLAGTNSGVELMRNSLKRWSIYSNNTAEGGANAGSDLTFGAWDDAGAFLNTAMFIKRSTQLPNFPLGTIFSPPASAPTLANGEATFIRTSNTVVTLQMRGTDGTLRHIDLTIAP
jgi:hypothetical protein